jgi:hypothetical protein
LEKLRKALDKENQKAVKHAQEKPIGLLANPVSAPSGGGPKM